MKFWRRDSWARQVIGHALCFCLLILPIMADLNMALADEIIQEAKKGQDTGANFLLNYTAPTINNGPPLGPIGPNELPIQDLFPGFDPSDPTQLTDLQNLGNNPEDLSTQGVASQFALGAGTDETSEAYQTANDGSNNPHYATIDMRTDTFLDVSREIISGDHAMLDEILTACAEDVTAGPDGVDTTTRLEDIWSCSQLRTGLSGSCTVTRDYQLSPVATQVVLTIESGGSCTPTGNDFSDNVLIHPVIGPVPAPGSFCASLNPNNPDWYLRFHSGTPPFGITTSYWTWYCGEFDDYVPTQTECEYTATQMEHGCRNYTTNVFSGFLVNPSHPTAGSPGADCATRAPDILDNYDGNIPVDYTGCPAQRVSFCQAMRQEYIDNCTGGCGSGSGPSLLNGTETITSPGLGPGNPEILPNQNVFGDTYDFTETAFNPGDYGLVAGEYVIADHVVNGDGITASTIDDGGSYGSNWDFTFTATAVDSTNLEVEATLYEIVSNQFIFTGCTQADVQNVESGTCTGTIACTDYTPPCRTVDGVQICEAPSASYGITQTLAPWSDFTSVPPDMCWEADVTILDCVGATNCIGNPACVADCDDLPTELQPACFADACWVDAQGNDVCLDSTAESWVNNLGDAGFADDCADLLGRAECSLRPEMSCVEGMEDPADPTNIDACLLRKRYFDCGYDVTVPGVPGADDVDVTCGAEIRCFGEECADTTAETNPDFVRAAVAASTVTESTKDMTCDIQGDPLSCRIFDGTDNRCRDPRGSYLGIIPDCCAESRTAGRSGGSFIEYMQLAYYSYRLAKDPIVASWLGQGQILPSAMENVFSAPANLGRAVSRQVVKGFNSALRWAGMDTVQIVTETGLNQGSIAASTTGFGPLQQFIATGVNNFLNGIGAGELANQLFTTTAEGTVTGWSTSGLGQMVGTALSVIGLIYTVYSILKILGSIFFGCEEEELAFGIQQVNRMCHYVGDYCSKRVSFLGFKKCVIETETHCCFGSPFARIVNEQLRLQGIGGPWGTARQPDCSGIPISELENVDWDLVDLSEWEAILFEAGLVPDPRNPPTNFVPTERHPGDATEGAEGETSTDANVDTINYVQDNLDDARFGLETSPLCQPDPELLPWYDDQDENGNIAC